MAVTAGRGMPEYQLEADLVREFMLLLESSSLLEAVSVDTEFDYRSGRADVIALDHFGRVFAFEAKLEKWRAALNQAYRNTCFAHISYVVLPTNIAGRALEQSRDFISRNVGICAVGEKIEVLLEPSEVVPLQGWLSEKAACRLQMVVESRE